MGLCDENFYEKLLHKMSEYTIESGSNRAIKGIDENCVRFYFTSI